jgi:hypothetical protein
MWRSNQYGDPDFLSSLNTCRDLNMSHAMLSWKYEMRRQAQMIIPFLWLGPSSVARDVGFLADAEISLMIAARSSKAVQTRHAFLDPAVFTSRTGIPTLPFDFDSAYEFITQFRPIAKAMNDHLERSCVRNPVESIDDVKGRILVFCESGQDRSAVLVIAYLMTVYGIHPFAAIHVVQSQRFCICVSDEMTNLLLDLQQILEAERQCAANNTTGQGNGKRSFDEVGVSDIGMHGIVLGDGLYGGREGVAPFIDVGH